MLDVVKMSSDPAVVVMKIMNLVVVTTSLQFHCNFTFPVGFCIVCFRFIGEAGGSTEEK